MTAAWMNAEDMERTCFGSFYRAGHSSKAVRPHTNASSGAVLQKSLQIGHFPECRQIRIAQFQPGCTERQNQFLPVARPRRCNQPFGLQDRKRQHHDRHGLMRQRQVDRHLMQQREDAEHGLQRDRRHQRPRAADNGRAGRATAWRRWREAPPGPAAHRRSCGARTAR